MPGTGDLETLTWAVGQRLTIVRADIFDAIEGPVKMEQQGRNVVDDDRHPIARPHLVGFGDFILINFSWHLIFSMTQTILSVWFVKFVSLRS